MYCTSLHHVYRGGDPRQHAMHQCLNRLSSTRSDTATRALQLRLAQAPPGSARKNRNDKHATTVAHQQIRRPPNTAKELASCESQNIRQHLSGTTLLYTNTHRRKPSITIARRKRQKTLCTNTEPRNASGHAGRTTPEHRERLSNSSASSPIAHADNDVFPIHYDT